ncbi:MAG: zinc ribbon domain-containing protein [Candidatus Hodarchaeota archaeon]
MLETNSKPPRGKRQLSRHLSEWPRGRVPEVLTYKCQEAGIQLATANPWDTSSYCPRCGQKGHKILAPNSFTTDPKGLYFHCAHCHFTADRDYVGALNLYRVQ